MASGQVEFSSPVLHVFIDVVACETIQTNLVESQLTTLTIATINTRKAWAIKSGRSREHRE